MTHLQPEQYLPLRRQGIKALDKIMGWSLSRHYEISRLFVAVLHCPSPAYIVTAPTAL